MTSPALGWLISRCLRWLLWLATAGYNIAFMLDRRDHFNSFGQLLHTTEFWMFGLPLAALFAGMFELMMRERAGFARPAFARDWTGRRPAAATR